MSKLHDVILHPVVSEKTTRQMEAEQTYTFKVAADANKIEIAAAVEKLFDVKVTGVRTLNYAGKKRRALMARLAKSQKLGRRNNFKKAVVTLAEGDHIELYELG